MTDLYFCLLRCCLYVVDHVVQMASLLKGQQWLHAQVLHSLQCTANAVNTQTDLSHSFGMILVRLQISGACLVLACDVQQLKVITITTTAEGMVSNVPIIVRLQS